MSEEKIVLTKKELQQIVKEAIKENLTEIIDRPLCPKNLFNDLSSELTQNIINLNLEYKVPAYSLRSKPDAIYPTYHGNNPILTTDFHDGIKKIVLSILGVRTNKQLLSKQYEDARTMYKEFSALAVELYEKRLAEERLKLVESTGVEARF